MTSTSDEQILLARAKSVKYIALSSGELSLPALLEPSSGRINNSRREGCTKQTWFAILHGLGKLSRQELAIYHTKWFSL